MSGGFDAADFIAGFIAEAEEHLTSANANLLSVEEAAAKGQSTPRQVRELFRSLHTIKGLAAMVGVEPIVDVAHAMEAVLRDADRAAGRLPRRLRRTAAGRRSDHRAAGACARQEEAGAVAPPALLNTLADLRQVPGDRRHSIRLDVSARRALGEAERRRARAAGPGPGRPTGARWSCSSCRRRSAPPPGSTSPPCASGCRRSPRSSRWCRSRCPPRPDAPAAWRSRWSCWRRPRTTSIAEAAATTPDALTPVRLDTAALRRSGRNRAPGRARRRAD